MGPETGKTLSKETVVVLSSSKKPFSMEAKLNIVLLLSAAGVGMDERFVERTIDEEEQEAESQGLKRGGGSGISGFDLGTVTSATKLSSTSATKSTF